MTRPAQPGEAGYSVSGRGFFLWYETRLEAKAWERELVDQEEARELPSASPLSSPPPPTTPESH